MLSSHSFLPPRAGARDLTRTTTAPGRDWRPAGAAPRYHLACRAARPDRDDLHDRFVSSCDGLSRPVLLRAGDGAGAPAGPVLPEAHR
ncbi:conserved domain protein [Actinomyces sp. oral taxon 170 str. F0386]|nr:conserved domain protein [Actinomyces sp. oral taxon 170 str. F0386]